MSLRHHLPFLRWGAQLNRSQLRADALAGLTGAVIVLPQGVAYALIAGMPAEYGLYTAIVTAIVAALMGSSLHLISGPAAALSIVVMSVASGQGAQTPADYIAIVLSLTLLAGLIQLALGLMRLGTLVNFISHTVVVGFTTGAAILIATSQLKYALGVQLPAGLSFIDTWHALAAQLEQTNLYALAIALTSLFSAMLIRRINRKLPHLLLGLLSGALMNYLLQGQHHQVMLVGALPGTLPPFTPPSLSADSLQSLASGALAIALLGLIEAVSIARAIAIRSHQQIDGNQEFIGQGLANIIGSLFSCFAGSGSFTRSGANYDAGAQTPMAAIFAALLLVLIILLIPGVTQWLPLPAMAGSILLIAWNLIDIAALKQIARAHRNEATILLVTLASTLFTELTLAIYIGVILSLLFYLKRTSQPTLMTVAPLTQSPQRSLRSQQRYQLPVCPQLSIVRLDGSLFFGAVSHVQQQLRQHIEQQPSCSVLLIAGKGINFIDVAGVEMLIQEQQRLKKQGITLAFCSLKGTVLDELDALGYLSHLDNRFIYPTAQAALADCTRLLDPAVCKTCAQPVFQECPTDTPSNLIAVQATPPAPPQGPQ